MVFASYDASPLSAALAAQQSFCCPRQYGQAPESAGAATTIASAQGATAGRSVMLGVMTGVIVWFITRTLNDTLGRKA